MNDNERYDQICQPAFERNKESDERIEGKIDDILGVLKGHDGEPGICERLRNVEKMISPDLEPRLQQLEKFQKASIAGIIAISLAFLGQAVAWAWSHLTGTR